MSAIVMVNTAGTIIYFSKDLEQLTGHMASEAVGKTLDLIIPETFRERHWTGFRKAMATGHSGIDGICAIIPVLCSDKQVRNLAGRFQLLIDPMGNSLGALVSYIPAELANPSFHVVGQPFS
jgi:PAS domain-containing protein